MNRREALAVMAAGVVMPAAGGPVVPVTDIPRHIYVTPEEVARALVDNITDEMAANFIIDWRDYVYIDY